MPTFREADTTETCDFLRTHSDGVLVDILTPEQHERQHIPGSRCACVFETAFLDHMEKMAPDRAAPVLVYGAGGCRDCAVAAEKLAAAGWRDVRVFGGGLDAWRAARLPLEGSEPQAVLPDCAFQTPLYSDYVLDPSPSLIRWTGRNDSRSHWGALRLRCGELHFDGVRGTGGAVADMTSITVDDLREDAWQAVLLAHLASEDFFLTSLFPEASMEIVDLTPLMGARDGLPNYHMEARVGIRGHEHPVEADVSVRNLSGDRLSLAGSLDLDRTRWGVCYGSARFFRYLGMHKVDDLITLDGRLIFKAN